MSCEVVAMKPGMIIKMRNRLWRVDNINKTELTATSIDGGEVNQRHFYLPFEKVETVERFFPNKNNIGSYSYNKLIIEANRLNLINSTAPFLSLQRSRIIPNQYQLVPLIMSLQMGRVRLLIADDVGLGKTIEAGLIATEMLARQQIRNILVVCPASIREQWLETLEYFFHIDAKIISSRHRKDLERKMPIGANPWSYHKFLITSLDYAKRPEIKNEILEQNWDLVILDEAHLVAKPHEGSGFNVQATDRYKFAKSISKNTKHLILMTATPHNGYSDSYGSLIDLLDVGAVQYKNNNVRVIPERAKNYIVQRRRTDVQGWFKEKGSSVRSPFPERDQDEVFITREKGSIEDKVLKNIEEYSKEVSSIYKNKNTGIYWTATHFHKRALSSPAALVKSLENRLGAIEKARDNLLLEEEELDYHSGDLSKDYIFDSDIEEIYTDEEASSITDKMLCGSKSELMKEANYLEGILDNAKLITPKKDSKLQKLLKDTIPNMFNMDKHIIIFTKYKDTLEYLTAQLEKKLKREGVSIITIIGEMNEDKRINAYNQFKRADKAILIATDCISEGINLQHCCSCLIHYELPWNPNRLEQRNGRIDRYGQPKDKVTIRTLVMDDSLETKILQVLIGKARQIHKDYGFTPPYFSDTNLLINLLNSKGVSFCNQQLSLFEEDNTQVFKIDKELFDEASFKRIKSESFYGQVDVKLDFVEKKLLETKIKIGTKEDIEKFCLSALNKFNVTIKSEDKEKEIYKIDITDSDLKIPRMSSRISFNPLTGLVRSDVEVIDLGHPLIKRLIEKISYLQYSKEEGIGRISGIYTRDCTDVTAVIYILVRYLTYSNSITIQEEIINIPINIYEDKVLSNDISDKLLRAEASCNNVDIETIRESIEELYTCTNYKVYIEEYISTRCKMLELEKESFNKHLSNNGIKLEENEIKLEVASQDIIAINLFYPL